MSSRIINLCCLLCCSIYVPLAFKEPGPYYYFFIYLLLFVRCIVLSVMYINVVVESDIFVLSSLHLLKMGE